MSEIQAQEQLAATNSRIDRIEVTLSHAVDTIEKIADAVNEVNKPQETKWGPILSAVGLLFVAGSGYTTLITMPLMERINNIEDAQEQRLERELDRARDIGRLEGALGIKIDE